MRNSQRLFAILSAAAVIGVLSTRPAQATDDKVFSAAQCIHNNDFVGGTPYYGSSARLFNTSTTSTLRVICPITRDSTLVAWSSVQVVAIDQSFTSGVSCRAISSSRDGNTSFTTVTKSTAGNASTGQILSFSGISEFDRGYFHILCAIPPKNSSGVASALTSYFIAEP